MSRPEPETFAEAWTDLRHALVVLAWKPCRRAMERLIGRWTA